MKLKTKLILSAGITFVIMAYLCFLWGIPPLDALLGIGTILYVIVFIVVLICDTPFFKKLISPAMPIIKKTLKIAFSKDSLIRVILILGILFLLISILKSCGIYKTPRRLSSSTFERSGLLDN